ncbi:MAG: ATP-binding protein [Deltaproteobacteria bacterium]|nr:ATP-binding protein [Deltaproteobacteria bacterium]
MITRNIENELGICLKESPAVVLTGPRQAGKTTLARAVCNGYPYFSFEDPLVRDLFHEDPRGFLEQCRNEAVFDEAQHVPELFSFLQGMIDDDPRPGRFVITGSQQFGLTESITQSLAGRVSILELLPFSVDELVSAEWLNDSLDTVLWKGAYPPVFDRALRPAKWYADYVTTYVQRDVRQVKQIQNLDQFTRFLRLCAGHVGQLFNASKIGSNCGMDQKTARKWLSILQAGYIATFLPPYHANFRKRIIKTPKLYFYDTGLVCHLLGIHDPAQLATHPLRGALFENWVFTELVKANRNRGRISDFWFWRTHGGQEVDFVFEQDGVVTGVEVKAGMSVRPTMLHSLNNTLDQWPHVGKRKVVLYGGMDRLALSGCDIVPWRQISTVF